MCIKRAKLNKVIFGITGSRAVLMPALGCYPFGVMLLFFVIFFHLLSLVGIEFD